MSPGKALHLAYEKSGTQVKTNQQQLLKGREAKDSRTQEATSRLPLLESLSS
jgi:hypothetical protein